MKLAFCNWCGITFMVIVIGIMMCEGNVNAREYQEGNNEWGLFLEGKNLEPDVKPYRTPEGMALPIRFVIEGLGGTIVWHANTKEVQAEIHGNQLYIHFQTGIATTTTWNGKQVDREQYSSPIIVAGRTMMQAKLLETIVNTSIACVAGVDVVNVHTRQQKENWTGREVQKPLGKTVYMLEQLANYVHEADEHLYKVFTESKSINRKQLEQLLTKYYSTEISQLIIDQYYRLDENDLYTFIATERPITIRPVTNIEEIEAITISSENEEQYWVLYVKRKQAAFSTFKVHSRYEFRLQNKQLIIVEILHHLVDNRGRANEEDGGGPRL